MDDDIPLPFDLPAVARKKMSAAFDGGRITSDGRAQRSNLVPVQPNREIQGSQQTCMGLFLSSDCFWVFLTVLCSERERPFFIPSPAIRFPGARGRGQGTEPLAELGGLPPSVACVSQRLDA